MHGLPIRPAFADTRAPQRVLRKRLGMDRHLPAVLLVGAQKLFACSASRLTWSSSLRLVPSQSHEDLGEESGTDICRHGMITPVHEAINMRQELVCCKYDR